MLRFLLIASSIITLSTTANAQDGWYGSLQGGVLFANDVVVDGDRMDFSTGWGVTGSVGRSFGAARVEGELFFGAANMNDIIVGALPPADVDGDVSAWGVMANAFFDINPDGAISPYVGGGVGFGDLTVSTDAIEGIPFVFKESSTEFAFQLIAGLSVPVSDGGSAFLVNYRYFDVSGFESHNVFAGFRFPFGG